MSTAPVPLGALATAPEDEDRRLLELGPCDGDLMDAAPGPLASSVPGPLLGSASDSAASAAPRRRVPLWTRLLDLRSCDNGVCVRATAICKSSPHCASCSGRCGCCRGVPNGAAVRDAELAGEGLWGALLLHEREMRLRRMRLRDWRPLFVEVVEVVPGGAG